MRMRMCSNFSTAEYNGSRASSWQSSRSADERKAGY
jgi:hypothetical protein